MKKRGMKPPNRPKQAKGPTAPYSVRRKDDEGMPVRGANQVGKKGARSKRRRAGM